jgi:hypothetical protein
MSTIFHSCTSRFRGIIRKHWLLITQCQVSKQMLSNPTNYHLQYRHDINLSELLQIEEIKAGIWNMVLHIEWTSQLASNKLRPQSQTGGLMNNTLMFTKHTDGHCMHPVVLSYMMCQTKSIDVVRPILCWITLLAEKTRI